MSLADFFDYEPMTFHYVVLCKPVMAQNLISRVGKVGAIKNCMVIRYTEPKNNTAQIKTLKRELAVCFLTYSAGAVNRMENQYQNIPGLTTIDAYQAYSIIKLTGEYPEYLKDREHYADQLTGRAAADVFLADMNKWIKHAIHG